MNNRNYFDGMEKDTQKLLKAFSQAQGVQPDLMRNLLEAGLLDPASEGEQPWERVLANPDEAAHVAKALKNVHPGRARTQREALGLIRGVLCGATDMLGDEGFK